MAQFNPEYAHDVLIPIAEVAYLPSLQADSLPPGYEVVGPIKVNESRAAAQSAGAAAQSAGAAACAALAPHLALVQRMRQDGDGFGWVVQNPLEHTLVVSFRGTVSLEDWLHDCPPLTKRCRTMARCTKVFRRFTK